MVTRPDDRSPDVTLKDLVTTLVTSASATDQRERLGRLLPRLDSLAVDTLDAPDARALARTQLSEAFLVALGPDAAQKELNRALDETDAIGDADGRARTLVEAAYGAAALGSFGTDLLARIESHAAALDPSVARARLFATLSVAYGKARDAQKASKLAIRALNSAEKVEALPERVEALVAVAVTLFGSHASRVDAREALDRGLEVARGLDAETERARALLSVAAAFGRFGLADEGLGALGAALGETAPEPEVPVAEEAPVAADPVEELEAIDEVEAIEAIEEISEVEEVPEVEEITAEEEEPAAPVAPRTIAPVTEKAAVPEGFVDPVAGVKFPTRPRRRR